jgi:hypothetical protein
MSDTAITPITLTADTVSADALTTAEGGTQVTTGNVGVVTVNPTDRLALTFYSAGAGTVTISAGAFPPAVRQGLGDKAAQTLPAGDCLLMVVEAARYMQANGTIRLPVTGTVVIGAFILPKTV